MGGGNENIFCFAIFHDPNIHIVWISVIYNARVVDGVALAVFCTLSFFFFDNFFWKIVNWLLRTNNVLQKLRLYLLSYNNCLVKFCIINILHFFATMKNIYISLLFILNGAVYHSSFAQSQFSGWLASFNTFKTGKKTSIHADVQWRSSDEFKHTQTLLLRSGLNIHLSKHLIVTAGYAFIHNRRLMGDVSGYAPEHRIWEQLLFTHKLKSIFVNHRLRLEQRFISQTTVQDNELVIEGSGYANRFRYFLRNVIPFQQQKTFSKGMFATLQNEVFFNVGNTGNVNGKLFDQNRFYLALGLRLHSSIDLETGYLNQYVSGRNGAFTNNHVWQIASYLRL